MPSSSFLILATPKMLFAVGTAMSLQATACALKFHGALKTASVVVEEVEGDTGTAVAVAVAVAVSIGAAEKFLPLHLPLFMDEELVTGPWSRAFHNQPAGRI